MERTFRGVIVLKYSFLVPVYNVEKYLEQCIESMLTQTYKNFEIILVDDGSTDNSGRICDDYSEKYPYVIKVVHKKNEGHTATRQLAIKQATGDMCLFVDSDDYVEPNMLETINKEMINDPSIDMIIFSFCYSNNGVKTKRKNYIFDKNEVFDGTSKKEICEALMFSSNINALWIKAIKTEILKSDPTDYSQIYGRLMAEDQYQSIYLVTAAKRIKCINAELYNYRTDNNSVTRTLSLESLSKKNMMYVYDRFIEILPEWGMNNNETIDRLKSSWLNLAIYTFNQYYKAAKSFQQRKEIVDFDWKTMIPEGAKDSEYNSPAALKTYRLIEKKKYIFLYILYLKNNYYKIIKKFLREKL